MQLQGGTHLVIPSVLRFLLMPAEDSYRLERPWPVVETQRSRNGLGESIRPAWSHLS
jgi:hypothetical protein